MAPFRTVRKVGGQQQDAAFNQPIDQALSEQESFVSQTSASNPTEGHDEGGKPPNRKGFLFPLLFLLNAKFSLGLILALFLMSGGIYLRYVDPWWVEVIRLKVFDSYNRLHYRDPGDLSAVVIVDLDEKSLAEVGQWPWPRSTIAQMLQAMRDYRIAVVGFDMVLSEPDRTSPALLAERLPPGNELLVKRLRELPSNETLMANAMLTVPSVLGQAATNVGLGLDVNETQHGIAPPIGLDDFRIPPPEISKYTSVRGFRGTEGVESTSPEKYIPARDTLVFNMEELESSASGLGMIALDNEVDGVVRRVPLIMNVESILKPTLAMEMLRVGFRGNSIYTVVNPGGLESVGLQTKQINLRVPVDGRGRVWVYYAKPDLFNMPDNSGRLYVSASDILNKRVPPERLAGRIALIGTSSVGLVDIRNTPVSPRQPGVEVHANLIENILTETFLSYPFYMVVAEMLTAIIACLLIIIFVPRVGPLWTLAGFGVTVVGLVGFSFYLFFEQRLLLDFTYASGLVFTVYATMAFANYTRDAQEKKQVRTAFSQYLSPDLVEQLAENPDQLRLGGETKRMTLLFCDVRGFTTISEKYKADPQGLTKLINRLLTPLTNEILTRRGTIDKYMGDCIMAFWNAPLVDDEQEYNACLSALAMFTALEKLNEERVAEAAAIGEDRIDLKIGVGVNTGDVVVGNMGSEQRFDYSVLGDAVNLASRLEGQSKSYGVDIVIGPDTARTVEDRLPVLELDLIAVKGKVEAVEIFTVIGDDNMKRDSEFTELLLRHNGFITAYRAQEWQEARDAMQVCRGLCNGKMDGFYTIFEERIQEYIDNPPPPDWDGVYIATSK